MKVLVCGGRDFSSYEHIRLVLSNLDISSMCQGGATGADSLAKKYAEENNIICTEFKAEWDKFGKAAGVIRNKQMLDEFKPDLVVAFQGGKGTNNMVEQAKKAGVKVLDKRFMLFITGDNKDVSTSDEKTIE